MTLGKGILFLLLFDLPNLFLGQSFEIELFAFLHEIPVIVRKAFMVFGEVE